MASSQKPVIFDTSAYQTIYSSHLQSPCDGRQNGQSDTFLISGNWNDLHLHLVTFAYGDGASICLYGVSSRQFLITIIITPIQCG